MPGCEIRLSITPPPHAARLYLELAPTRFVFDPSQPQGAVVVMDRALLDMAAADGGGQRRARCRAPPGRARACRRGRCLVGRRGGADPAPGRGAPGHAQDRGRAARHLGAHVERRLVAEGALRRAVGIRCASSARRRCCAAARSAWRRVARARLRDAANFSRAFRRQFGTSPAPSRPRRPAALHRSPRRPHDARHERHRHRGAPCRACALRRYADLPGRAACPGWAARCRSSRRASTCSSRTGAASSGRTGLELAGRHILVVGDHEAVAAVLRDRPRLCAHVAARGDLTEMAAPGVFGANGETWRRQRHGDGRLRPGARAALLPVAARRRDATGAALGPRGAGQHHAIDLQADLMRYTVDTIAGLAFGAEVNTLETATASSSTWTRSSRRCSGASSRHCRCASGARRPTGRSSAPRRGAPRWTASSPRRGRGCASSRRCARIRPTCSGHARRRRRARQRHRRRAGRRQRADHAARRRGRPPTPLAWAIHLLWQHPQSEARATEEVRRCVLIRCRRRWSSSRSSTTSRPAPTRRCA